jgi:sugar phosphate isomerase/epimerase
MDRLAIEFISALGMPPADYVELAARLGVAGIGIAPTPIAANPHGYPAWDLRADPALMRATKAALSAHGVHVSLGEGFLIMAGIEIADAAATMDLMAELGAPMVNTIVMEQDRPCAFDQFVLYAGMAAERGMLACLEYMPMMWPINIHEAAAFVADSGAANARVLVDAMHFYRSGSSAAELAEIEPAAIGYVQICDVPMPATNPDYGMEARDNRLPPGEGDLPLGALLKALPRDIPVGLELPMAAKAAAGVGPEERLRPAIAAARELLAALD